jgi:plastocyanin
MQGFRRHILTPLAIPVAAATIILIVVFNISRVLLFLEKRHSATISTAIAILLAAAVLFCSAYFAAAHRRPAAGLPVLGTVAMILLFAGGYGAGASHGVKEGGGESASGGGGQATLGAVNFAFDPKEVTLPAGIINITMRNDGSNKHTFQIENHPEFKKLEAEPGTSATGAAKLRPGTYTFYCSELGHRGSGMEGKLTVTAAGKQ